MSLSRPDADRRHAAILAAVVLVQAVAVLFFVGDATADIARDGPGPETLFEGFIAFALSSGVAVGGWQLRRALETQRAQARALDVARGALAEVIEAQFSRWGLTPAERDVALFALKGLDVAEIADLRGAATGTVRAQMARVYAKSGVSGRAQFAALFVEDLLG
ncbi:helix-turn-helix transcriptional regulator [Rhodobacter maris]|uniref:DNA-binding CsgD family transcriptional regulator n=1 Tax=Rhodobacter maris TaxID=446682 RepID=A0A285T2V0_9RHOB|nr:helix-turn-helix transcriptional regulator [Rhodobacter maris]SOC15378.1 DNA-binding CsgD family transcriptional regulator [Rhodobacter maris]